MGQTKKRKRKGRGLPTGESLRSIRAAERRAELRAYREWRESPEYREKFESPEWREELAAVAQLQRLVEEGVPLDAACTRLRLDRSKFGLDEWGRAEVLPPPLSEDDWLYRRAPGEEYRAPGRY